MEVDNDDREAGFDSPIPIAKAAASSIDGSDASVKLADMGLATEGFQDDLAITMQSLSTEATNVMAQSRTLL